MRTINKKIKSIRLWLLERWMKRQDIATLSVRQNEEAGEREESYFSHSGCDVCSPGLGNNVYDVIGYSPEDHEVYEVGQVCHECLAAEANGFDSTTEVELDNESIRNNLRR